MKSENQNTQTKAATIEIIRGLAGPYFDELWSSREAVLTLITHSLSPIRAAAIICGSERWGYRNDPVFLEHCFRIASSDVGQARHVAITHLGEIFFCTKNRRVERLFSIIIANESESSHIRNHAYRMLRQIEFGFEYEMSMQMARESKCIAEGEAIPLMDIDWSFIDHLRDEGDGEGTKGDILNF